MTRLRTLVCGVAMIAVLGACSRQPARENSAEDERLIRETELAASSALAAKDLDRLISLYADNAALYYEDHPMVAGKIAIRDAWQSIMSRPGFAMSTEPLRIDARAGSELAFARGAYELTLNDARGTPATEMGEYVVVYQKHSDDSWKIIADNGNSDLRVHSLPEPPDRRQAPPSSIGPLFGMAALAGGLWFLVGMPVCAMVFSWKSLRARKLSAGVLVAAVMLIVFWTTALLLWRHFAMQYWNLSLGTALEAAGDAARYGHPMEHTAEVLVVNLLIFSSVLSAASGAITLAGRHLWLRCRRSAA